MILKPGQNSDAFAYSNGGISGEGRPIVDEINEGCEFSDCGDCTAECTTSRALRYDPMNSFGSSS